MTKSKEIAIVISVMLGLSVLQVKAQEVLTLEEAVGMALKNNYEILLANNDLEVDQTSVSPGLAGMLPRVFLSSRY